MKSLEWEAKLELDTRCGIIEVSSKSISCQKWYLKISGLAAVCLLVSLYVKDERTPF